MNLLQNFNNNAKNLSEVESYCFQTILKMEHFHKDVTIQWLADELNVSTTTIFRMCKKLGYPSFKQFRYDLLYHKRDAFEVDVLPDHSVLSHIRKQIDESFDLLMDFPMDKMIDQLLHAHTVLICSTGMNNYIAKILSIKLSLMGVTNVYPDDQWFMYLEAINLKHDDFVIILSKAGETQELIKVVKNAKLNGAKILLIGETGASTLETLSDFKMSLAKVENEGYDIDTRLQMHLAIHYLTKEVTIRKQTIEEV